MSAAAHFPAAPEDPDPPRATPAMPSAIGRVLRIVRRPIGAVIVDICRDLGITPDQFDRASWDALSLVIMAGLVPAMTDDAPHGPCASGYAFMSWWTSMTLPSGS
jgi:hypothetical protein